MDKADLVIKSNAVFTGAGLAPFKGGVAVAGDRIVACGEDKYLDAFIGHFRLLFICNADSEQFIKSHT